MDYSLITEQEIQKRFDTLSPRLRTILSSSQAALIARQICARHFLNAERTLMIEQLVGLTLLGFLALDDLPAAIGENLHLNQKHANALAQELESKIFRPVLDELEAAYAPKEQVEEKTPPAIEIPVIKPTEAKAQKETKPVEKVVPVKTLLEEEKLGERALEVKVEANEEAKKEETPFILYNIKEDAGVQEKEKRKISIKGFTFPTFKFFGRERAKEGPAPKASIETGETPSLSEKQGEQKRVVHYSELRTPLAPFGLDEETIMPLETTPKEAPTPPPTPPSGVSREQKAKSVPEPTEAEKPESLKKTFWWFKPRVSGGKEEPLAQNRGSEIVQPQPKLEGNTVDLR